MSEIFENWASFRPQYMIGSGNNKDCEEWFFDRKCRVEAIVSVFRMSKASSVSKFYQVLASTISLDY